MKRVTITARPNWQEAVEASGMVWPVTENGPYWNEAMKQPVYYRLTKDEQISLEMAGNTLQQLCFESLEWLLVEADEELRTKWFNLFCIPAAMRPHIVDSWEANEWGIYGRFDFLMVKGVPKLLEYNADTPTTLIESAVTQWDWLVDNKEKLGNVSQFNIIHEALENHWKDWAMETGVDHVDFVSMSTPDDFATVTYMAETASSEYLTVQVMPIEAMGCDGTDFIDLNNQVMDTVFKLYPWEWMLEDEFGKHVPFTDTRWIEPSWKMLLSNKMLLALLWERYGEECPYLLDTHTSLEAALENSFVGDKWVQKPILSREGKNITIWYNGYGGVIEFHKTDGEYGECPCVYQLFAKADKFDNCLPMLGVWMVGEEAVGLGIREDDSDITQNNSRFIPHVFEVGDE